MLHWDAGKWKWKWQWNGVFHGQMKSCRRKKYKNIEESWLTKKKKKTAHCTQLTFFYPKWIWLKMAKKKKPVGPVVFGIYMHIVLVYELYICVYSIPSCYVSQFFFFACFTFCGGRGLFLIKNEFTSCRICLRNKLQKIIWGGWNKLENRWKLAEKVNKFIGGEWRFVIFSFFFVFPPFFL